jgi:hypothetical protein
VYQDFAAHAEIATAIDVANFLDPILGTTPGAVGSVHLHIPWGVVSGTHVLVLRRRRVPTPGAIALVAPALRYRRSTTQEQSKQLRV